MNYPALTKEQFDEVKRGIIDLCHEQLRDKIDMIIERIPRQEVEAMVTVEVNKQMDALVGKMVRSAIKRLTTALES